MDDLSKLIKGSGRDHGFYFDWDKGQTGVSFPVPTLGGGWGEMDLGVDFSKERTVGDTRAAAQGIGLGWGDEAEAAVRSAFGGRPYNEIVNEIIKLKNN